jgi:hypothetical protein
MTGLTDPLSEKVAAAQALPQARGMQELAERLVRMRPDRSLAEVREILLSSSGNRYAQDEYMRGVRATFFQRGAAGNPVSQPGSTKRAEPVAPPKPKPAFYSVADAKETAYLCRIARAPELAANFIAAKTPIVKVREALTQRSDQILAQRAKEAIALIARKKAITAEWDEVVAKVNAENPRSAPAKTDPWAEIVSDINAQHADSGSRA